MPVLLVERQRDANFSPGTGKMPVLLVKRQRDANFPPEQARCLFYSLSVSETLTSPPEQARCLFYFLQMQLLKNFGAHKQGHLRLQRKVIVASLVMLG
jgi:hypothetical protein